jgi:tetratricopeptide (TPR) repeat protein
VSQVPAEIAGIGSTQQRLRRSPGFDLKKVSIGPEEYFVLDRIDGKLTLRQVLLEAGLPMERAIAIITKLRSIGALLLPGETIAPPPVTPKKLTPVQGVPAMTASGSGARKPMGQGTVQTPVANEASKPNVAAGTREIVPTHDLTLPNTTLEELAALAEQIDPTDSERRRILAMARLLDARDPHALLGVPDDASPRELKRAYFLLSKEIHPDRYYNKRLGSFAKRMPAVFEAATRAYDRLLAGDRAGRSGAQRAISETNDQPQTPQAYAAELFDRACQLEVGGDALEAMKLFAAAVRVDAQLPYLRRATSCAITAGQPKSAVEYAKKVHALAPADPSSARLLAKAFRAAGKLSDAEEVLVLAMALKSENDALMFELRNDLADIRRLLAQ